CLASPKGTPVARRRAHFFFEGERDMQRGILCAALAALFFSGCGGGSNGGPSGILNAAVTSGSKTSSGHGNNGTAGTGSATLTATPPAPPPYLVAARWEDNDGDGRASLGDVIR